jgi:hypothetical protein
MDYSTYSTRDYITCLYSLEDDMMHDENIDSCRIFRHDDQHSKKIMIKVRAKSHSSVVFAYFHQAVHLANLAVHVQRFDESIVDIQPCIEGAFAPLAYIASRARELQKPLVQVPSKVECGKS